MTWARIDDSFDGHPKTRRLSLAAAGLFARALSHAAQYLTDGHVDDAWVETTGRRRERQRALAELEAQGMFVRVDGGWLIHDYLDFNPSRRQIEALRKSSGNRQALARDPALRQLVRSRDADRCRYCDAEVDFRDRRGATGGTYDHVEPRGPNTPDNLVVACRGCNASKRGRTPAQAGMPLLPPKGAQMDLGSRSDLDRSRDVSTPPRWGGRKTNGNAHGNGSELDARVDLLLAELAGCRAYSLDPVVDRGRVAKVLALYPKADALASAKRAALWGDSPDWRTTDGIAAFEIALRNDSERKQGPPAAGRAKAEREQADLDAILRHAEARS